jgi:hypothetical protein
MRKNMFERQKRKSLYSGKSNIDVRKQNNKNSIKNFLRSMIQYLNNFLNIKERIGTNMEIGEILNNPQKDTMIKVLRVIEEPQNISSPLEIHVESEIEMDNVEKSLIGLEHMGLVRQEAGFYGITFEGINVMKTLRKNKLF